MIDKAKLDEKVKEVGLKYGAIASRMGISSAWLWAKRCGKVDFSVSEVEKLCEILNITDCQEMAGIFFAQKVK